MTMARLFSCLVACSSRGKQTSLVRDDLPCGFKVVLDDVQREENVFVNAVWEDNVIQLCDVTGSVLKRIPLSECEWSSCTLPNRVECVSLQYPESGKVEILLQSTTPTDIDTVISELTQSKALCKSTGRHVSREKQRTSEMEASLRQDIRHLQGRLRDVVEERAYLVEENGRLRDEITNTLGNQGACTPDQMEKCLMRIEELEKRNVQIQEDLKDEMRRNKSMSEHMRLMRQDLEQSCEEKSALVESLHTAHTQLHDLQSNAVGKRNNYSLD